MKKIRLLLALVLASVGSIQGMWAERTAPEMPTSTTIVSGNKYVLYNVDTKEFLYRDNGMGGHATDKMSELLFFESTGTAYCLKDPTTNYYVASYGYDTMLRIDAYNSWQFYFTPVEGGYQVSVQAHEDNFVGITTDRYINSNLMAGNLTWLILTETQAARLALYNALVAADAYGFNKDVYETIYADANSTNAALITAAQKLNYSTAFSKAYVYPDWNEVPIRFDQENAGDWAFSSYYNYFYEGKAVKSMGTSSFSAYVVLDQEATMVYEAWAHPDYLHSFDVYLDGVLYDSFNGCQSAQWSRYFIEMTPGAHTIKWVGKNMSSYDYEVLQIGNVGVLNTPTVSVSLLEPGSLGTEVLYQVNHIKDVRKLVVSGTMNEEDWGRIAMMTTLLTLDLSDAEVTTLPDYTFDRQNRSTQSAFLHSVKLPKNLETIGLCAFRQTYLTDIQFPTTLKTIGYNAFQSSNLREALIPSGVTTVGIYAFNECRNLKTASYPAAAKTIPRSCFEGCYGLQRFDIPEGIISIGNCAFRDASNFNTRFPSTLQSIDYYAFQNCAIDELILPENVYISYYVFQGNSRMIYAELPTSFARITTQHILLNCNNLKDLWLKSPTMITSTTTDNLYSFLSSYTELTDLTLHVPSYLVNSYKLDSYWYNFNIEGFSTADITDWTISQPLTLSGHDRFEGTPNWTLMNQGSVKVNGDAAQPIGNLSMSWNLQNRNGDCAQLFSNCDNVSISGTLTQRFYVQQKKWHFVSLPFDVKVGNIVAENGAKFAVRYYDGANRAANGAVGSWKNYTADDVIPAGTGFIVQASAEDWLSFPSQSNASKQNVVSNTEFVKSLLANNSATAADKGWNLVGNPWMCYYNTHKLNFTAPITVWNFNNRTYEAYSLTDDDYALSPGQAFFVQCPDEITSIGFPIDGRQLDDEITDQNGVKAMTPQVQMRRLIDVELSNGELSDKTRLVLNEQAKTAYEVNCDATKFFSLDAAVPQIYTIQNEDRLAINERPLGEGEVAIGFKVAADGTYTIRTQRNQFESILLVDTETGEETDLSQSDYTFYANAGTSERRFLLKFQGGTTTDIAGVESSKGIVVDKVYNLSGQRVKQLQHGINIVNGKKVMK